MMEGWRGRTAEHYRHGVISIMCQSAGSSPAPAVLILVRSKASDLRWFKSLRPHAAHPAQAEMRQTRLLKMHGGVLPIAVWGAGDCRQQAIGLIQPNSSDTDAQIFGDLTCAKVPCSHSDQCRPSAQPIKPSTISSRFERFSNLLGLMQLADCAVPFSHEHPK
jgi:hypothetical protein